MPLCISASIFKTFSALALWIGSEILFSYKSLDIVSAISWTARTGIFFISSICFEDAVSIKPLRTALTTSSLVDFGEKAISAFLSVDMFEWEVWTTWISAYPLLMSIPVKTALPPVFAELVISK